MKETLKGILCADYPDLALKKSGLTKTDIKPLADQGDLDAMLVLLFGLSCNAVGEIWNEDFEDEDTHEIISIRFAFIHILFDCIPVQELLAAVLDPFALELRRTMCEGELNLLHLLPTPLYRPPPDLWLYRDYPR